MLLDDLVAHAKERLIWAVRTFHFWLVADSAPPFVSAGRGIAATSRFRIFPANRKDICAASKQTPKKRDLGLNRRAPVDGGAWLRPNGGGGRRVFGGLRSQCFNFGDNRRPLFFERLKARQKLGDPIRRSFARRGPRCRFFHQGIHLVLFKGEAIAHNPAALVRLTRKRSRRR